MRRSLQDLHAHADELADAFEGNEPSAADFDATVPPLIAAVSVFLWWRRRT